MIDEIMQLLIGRTTPHSASYRCIVFDVFLETHHSSVLSVANGRIDFIGRGLQLPVNDFVCSVHRLTLCILVWSFRLSLISFHFREAATSCCRTFSAVYKRVIAGTQSVLVSEWMNEWMNDWMKSLLWSILSKLLWSFLSLHLSDAFQSVRRSLVESLLEVVAVTTSMNGQFLTKECLQLRMVGLPAFLLVVTKWKSICYVKFARPCPCSGGRSCIQLPLLFTRSFLWPDRFGTQGQLTPYCFVVFRYHCSWSLKSSFILS